MTLVGTMMFMMLIFFKYYSKPIVISAEALKSVQNVAFTIHIVHQFYKYHVSYIDSDVFRLYIDTYIRLVIPSCSFPIHQALMWTDLVSTSRQEVDHHHHQTRYH